MPHKHPIYDSDPHFTIDPITRKIVNHTAGKTKLMQYDHNSERFTFGIPRFVDGHDMSLSNKVEIHYINIATNNGQQTADVYPVTDVAINEEMDEVYFSWLISRNATQIVGTLNFIIKFICLDGDDITYTWNTDIFKNIAISGGINNGESVVTEYSDVLEAWKAEVIADSKADIIASVDREIEAKTAEKIAETNTAIDTKTAQELEKIEAKGAEVTEAATKEILRSQNQSANALKGTASGEVIVLTDVSPLEHEMSVKVSGVEDISTVEVKKYGKNLYSHGSSLTNTKNTTKLVEVSEGKTYTASAVLTTEEGTTGRIRWKYVLNGADAYTNDNIFINSGKASSTFTVPSGATDVAILFQVGTGTAERNWSNIQVEVGNTATDYEPYIEPVTYTPNADGAVEGVTSLYPTTTLMTNTAGVTIEAGYNKDINKVIASLVNAIISLGGNV